MTTMEKAFLEAALNQRRFPYVIVKIARKRNTKSWPRIPKGKAAVERREVK